MSRERSIAGAVTQAIEIAPTMYVHADEANAGLKITERAYITAYTPTDFADLMQEVARQVPGSYDESQLEETIEHESDHAFAANRLGATAVHFEVGFSNIEISSGGNRLAIQARVSPIFGRTLTPLEYAAVDVHPLCPGPHDLRNAAQLGFSSIDQVGRSVQEHNFLNPDEPLPLPRSYQEL